MRYKFAWAGFVLGLLGLVSCILLWASYIRLVSRVTAWGWLEARPLTWSGTVSPLLALVGLLVSGGTLLVLREGGQRRGRGFARIGLITGLLGLAVVYPWFMCARDIARRSVCSANMAGWQKAVSVYVSRNHERRVGRWSDTKPGPEDYPPDLDSLLRVWPHNESMLVCPSKYPDGPHDRYSYIPGSWEPNPDPRNVVLYEQRWNHLSDGGNVLFADWHAEWVQPYSRVLELVEQTKQRLAAKAVQSAPTSAIAAASQPAP